MNYKNTPYEFRGLSGSGILSAAVFIGMSWCSGEARAQTDGYGGYSIETIYSADAARTLDEELDSSAIVGRLFGGVRLGPEDETLRLEASSSYYGYFSREDRLANRIEAEKTFAITDETQLIVEASAANNLITLERRDTDQVSLGARIRFDRGDHRVTLGTAFRRRWYGDGANAWSPIARAEYRYRIGSWHFLEVRATADQVNGNVERLDYKRLEMAGFYTIPITRRTRLRTGITHRRWTWEDRFTLGGQQRRDRLWIPQIRLAQEISKNAEIMFDYRHVIRRSNDNDLDRSGNRISISFRNSF